MMFLHDFFEFDYLRYTLCAIVLASIACGIVGGYIVAQRQSYMIGAVSHSLLGGVGLARFLQVVVGLTWFTPLLGATCAALIAAFAITCLTMKTKARQDAVLSAVWTLGVALGVSCMAMTPGYAEDLSSYLFGSILLVSPADLVFMGLLDVVIIVLSWFFHNRFLTLCFRQETLELRGISPLWTALLLNSLIALTVVLLSQIVGIVLVLVLVVLPASMASFFHYRLGRVMLTAGLVCLVCSLLGVYVSYTANLPTGATIVEITVAAFLISAAVKRVAIRWRSHRRG